MQNLNLLAWLYWNPPKEVFTVPIIDRPIVWYGILFVAGFILGYFLFVHILARYLTNSKSLSIIDVHHWPKLIQSLQNASSNSPEIVGHDQLFVSFRSAATPHLQRPAPRK